MNQIHNGKYLLRQVLGEFYLIDVDSSASKYHDPLILNESGADICRLLLDGIGIEEICQYMTSEYGISELDAQRDIHVFMKVLEDWMSA